MADNLSTFMYQMARNSGSLNLLEPCGPVQACNGIALVFKIEYTFKLKKIQVPFVLEDKFLMTKKKNIHNWIRWQIKYYTGP
jgi:hypothetical protein